MLAAKVHESQRVIRVVHRFGEFSQGQPTDAAVIVLHELAVGVAALGFVQLEILAHADALADQVIVVGLGALGAFAVGPAVVSSCSTPISTRI